MISICPAHFQDSQATAFLSRVAGTTCNWIFIICHCIPCLDANFAQAHLFRIHYRRFTKLSGFSGFSVDLLPANSCLSRREGCEATDAARKLLQGRSDPRCDMYQCLRRRTVCCGTRCDAEGENGGWQRWGESRTNAKPNSWIIQCLQPRKVPANLKRVCPAPIESPDFPGTWVLSQRPRPHTPIEPRRCVSSVLAIHGRWVCARMALR
jgi:hypothetical protein